MKSAAAQQTMVGLKLPASGRVALADLSCAARRRQSTNRCMSMSVYALPQLTLDHHHHRRHHCSHRPDSRGLFSYSARLLPAATLRLLPIRSAAFQAIVVEVARVDAANQQNEEQLRGRSRRRQQT